MVEERRLKKTKLPTSNCGNRVKRGIERIEQGEALQLNADTLAVGGNFIANQQ